MNPPHAGKPLNFRAGIRAARLLLAALVLLSPVRAAPGDDGDVKVIDREDFALKYPANWKENAGAPDYKADSEFTLNSPHDSYIQFSIVDKAQDAQKVLNAAMQGLDGPAITTLSKSKIDKWGEFSGSGMHLKGKLFDIDPGGIKLFIFNSEHHNVLVIEFYKSSELKDVQSDLDFISQNFKMKN